MCTYILFLALCDFLNDMKYFFSILRVKQYISQSLLGKIYNDYTHRRMRRGGAGGAAPPPNSGKQWVKFGQSKKKKSARESYKLTPLECGWWRHTGNVQGGGGACECPRVGVFFKFWEGGWRHAGNVQGGGGACGYLCKISGRSTPLPPLTKAFPYAYDYTGIF